MIMKVLFYIFTGSLLLLAGCASEKAESYTRAGFNFAQVDKVAVVEVSGQVRGNAVKNQIADFFAMELLKKGYSPIERKQVQAILEEQDFQASDITTNEGAARAGRILNVPVVMLVNIPTYKEEMNMTAKLINVEDGSILWLGSGSGSTGKTFGTILGAAAGAVAGSQVGNGRTEGAVIGGVLGGVAGRALSPQQAEQVQKLIKKVTENLPPRLGQ